MRKTNTATYRLPAEYRNLPERARDQLADLLFFIARNEPPEAIARWCRLPLRVVARVTDDLARAASGLCDVCCIDGPPWLPTPTEIAAGRKETRIHGGRLRRACEYVPRHTAVFSTSDIQAALRDLERSESPLI